MEQEHEMSKKIQLPDEVLEMVSGGIFTLDGKKVDMHSHNIDGITLKTDQGLMFYPWTDRAHEEFSTYGMGDKVFGPKVAFKERLDKHEYRLEDYTGEPYLLK